MDKRLDEEFRSWIGKIAEDWSIPADEVPNYLGRGEIKNRLDFYPALGLSLRREPIDLREVEQAARKCWALQGRFESIRFGEFIGRAESAGAIARLVRRFPEDAGEAAARIDLFITECAQLGYALPSSGNPSRASAALLTSVILTAILRERFVDFRQSRWIELAAEPDYPLFGEDKPTHVGC